MGGLLEIARSRLLIRVVWESDKEVIRRNKLGGKGSKNIE